MLRKSKLVLNCKPHLVTKELDLLIHCIFLNTCRNDKLHPMQNKGSSVSSICQSSKFFSPQVQLSHSSVLVRFLSFT